jgi:hypothetical protein
MWNGIPRFCAWPTERSFGRCIASKQYYEVVRPCRKNVAQQSSANKLQGGEMMRMLRIKKIASILSAGAMLFMLFLSPAHAVFINEIHYDNVGGDAGEGVELAGAAGQDLAGWSLQFYNGGNGSVYRNYALSGVFSDMQQGMGFLAFAVNGIQNGGADGMALVDAAGGVLQFLSYEGSLIATGGAAMGMSSIDIGVSENGSTAVGGALQLQGSGRDYSDFLWGVGQSSFGGINPGQGFVAPAMQLTVAVPEPASSLLLLVGLLVLVFARGVKNNLGLAYAV